MVSSLGVWHLLIICGVLAVIVLAIAVIIFVVVRASSKNQQAASASSTSERLAQLEQAKAAGLISEDEYQAKRAQILGQL